MGKTPELVFNLGENGVETPQPLAYRFGHIARDVRQRQVKRHEKLPGFIVYCRSDTPDLLFEGLIQVAQSGNRLIEATMGHFVRRYALGEELVSGLQCFWLRRGRVRTGQDADQRDVMKSGHLEQTPTIRKCLSAQIVGPAEGRLTGPLEMLLQNGEVSILEREFRQNLRLVSGLHTRLPV
ncbi:MAG: hypothetical protein AUG07_06570 [Acidobacteria bacterium 13_1_20CM_2_60_10]|nr:MAG: hypothetical protein AUG07_06570 [Acidobacteria bacterium 13_1_20CM_2_60_10]